MSLVLAVPTNHRKGDHEKKSEKLAENVVSSSKDEMRSSEDESKETKFGMFVVQPNSEGTYEKRLVRYMVFHFNSFSVGTVFVHQILTSVDVRF